MDFFFRIIQSFQRFTLNQFQSVSDDLNFSFPAGKKTFSYFAAYGSHHRQRYVFFCKRACYYFENYIMTCSIAGKRKHLASKSVKTIFLFMYYCINGQENQWIAKCAHAPLAKTFKTTKYSSFWTKSYGGGKNPAYIPVDTLPTP